MCLPAYSLGLYGNKVIQHVACQNHTHEYENHTHKFENHTQHAKIIRMSWKISGIAASQNPIQFFFGNPTLILFKITIVHISITLFRVKVTLICVHITLVCVEITLCV
jgi:hypothetical protein